MFLKTRQMLTRLHKDESGPNTVEWILLIIVALIVLLGIYFFAQYVSGQVSERREAAEGEADTTSTGMADTGQ